MDFSRKGVVVSRTNLIENKKTVSLPWKGVSVIVLVVGGLWFGSKMYLEYAKKDLAVVKTELENLRKGRDYEKIASVADASGRLVSIEAILKNRVHWGNLFLALEKNTTKEVTFNSMEARAELGGNNPLGGSSVPVGEKKYQITLSGETTGIVNVSKQVAAFKDENNEEQSFAKKVRLENVSLKSTSFGDPASGLGNVSFGLSVEVNPNVFEEPKE